MGPSQHKLNPWLSASTNPNPVNSVYVGLAQAYPIEHLHMLTALPARLISESKLLRMTGRATLCVMLGLH